MKQDSWLAKANTSKEVLNQTVKETDQPKYTPLQWLKLELGLPAYLEHRTRLGWHGPLPFYAFRCKKHGIVENYPQGHHQILRCPKCDKEDTP